jgi:hypothetical protein
LTPLRRPFIIRSSWHADPRRRLVRIHTRTHGKVVRSVECAYRDIDRFFVGEARSEAPYRPPNRFDGFGEIECLFVWFNHHSSPS